MRIEVLGGADPEVAIVGGIHGDEPCGVRAIEQLLAERPPVERPVALVVANEAALAADERYVEEDLNRAFPGDPDGETHESRLAARLAETLADCLTLSLHSTQSYRGMFALLDHREESLLACCRHLSIDAVVDVGTHHQGRLFDALDELIEIECGYQGSDRAAENATQVAREFLGAVGALPGEQRPPQAELPLFRLRRPIRKRRADTYEVYASNFEHVSEGEPFAAVDDAEVVAEEGFYPVLLSPYGYETVFGYAAERVGTVTESVETQ